MRRMWVFAGLVGLSAWTLSSHAVQIPFDLQGKAGAGLLSGNENSAIAGTPGSGGEIGAGISLETATNVLTINVGWGTGNGFTNLSGNATAGHIHGLTTSPAPASFNENATVLIGLDSGPGWTPSATNGSIIQSVNLSAVQVTDLLAGRMYVNVHTVANGGGEIRGQLIAVPEPTSLALVGLGAMALLRRRRGA